MLFFPRMLVICVGALEAPVRYLVIAVYVETRNHIFLLRFTYSENSGAHKQVDVVCLVAEFC